MRDREKKTKQITNPAHVCEYGVKQKERSNIKLNVNTAHIHHISSIIAQ